jgi:hypothetical protein
MNIRRQVPPWQYYHELIWQLQLTAFTSGLDQPLQQSVICFVSTLHFAIDHRTWKTGLPVRSAVLKPQVSTERWEDRSSTVSHDRISTHCLNFLRTGEQPRWRARCLTLWTTAAYAAYRLPHYLHYSKLWIGLSSNIVNTKNFYSH